MQDKGWWGRQVKEKSIRAGWEAVHWGDLKGLKINMPNTENKKVEKNAKNNNYVKKAFK